MKEKIKVLFTNSQKLAKKRKGISLGDMIERETPEMYEFYYAFGEEDIMKQVSKFKHEIVFISQIDKKIDDSIGLLKKIKQLHPRIVVFAILPNTVDDEQETIDRYISCGTYKCLSETIILETLVHDMYVALNLE
jgi:DNA-binding NarL/FixJ family response regulator